MSEDKSQTGAYASPAQIGAEPKSIVRRWLLELSLSEKAQRDWIKDGEKIWERYRGKKAKKNSFNILWSNTETLRQAVYNTLPKPDVRRRFRDADPVGKVVSDVLERSVDYAMDVYDFDHVLKLDLLDMLLPGRGLSRVRYVPDFEDVVLDTAQPTEAKEGEGVAPPQTMQRIVDERVMCEHVDWTDFRHGPGKTWDEVRWIAFRHRFSQAAGIEKFGEGFRNVPMDEVADDEVKKACKDDAGVADLFKTVEVWEIWNKDDKEVLFIAPSYKENVLSSADDPLGLDGFYPIPRPLYAIEDSTTMLPSALFEKYKEQADELDLVTARINKLTAALKLRGVYNSVMAEVEALKEADDNELIPAKNAAALLETGIEKHIWMMPIQLAAEVIEVLGRQREATKAVIYEITGIADIMRGATDAQETYGAQKIKTQWGTQRLKKMQSEFQRYVRDIIRLKSQIIANKFQPQTVIEMTGLKLFGSEAEKAEVQKLAALAKQPPQPGMQPAQPPSEEQLDMLGRPTWEQVFPLLKNKVHRNYRIGIETDSTIAGSIESDMQGLQQVLQGVTGFIQGVGPAVQAGAMPIEAVKEIVLTIARRARMGMAVEDSLEKLQAPQQQSDGKAQAEQAKLAADQQKAQMDAALEREKMQSQQMLEAQKMQAARDKEMAQMQADERVEAARAQADMAIEQNRAELSAQMEQIKAAAQQEADRMRMEFDAQIEQMKAAHKAEIDIQLALIKKDTAVEVAQINAATVMTKQQDSAANASENSNANV